VDSGGLMAQGSMRYWVHIGANWWIRLNSPCSAACKNGRTYRNAVGVWTWVGPRNHALDGVQIAPCQWAIFRGKDIPGHAQPHSAVGCAKMAEPIEMPFGLSTRMGPRKHLLDGINTDATWRIAMNRPCAAAMRLFCQITLTTCYYYYENLRWSINWFFWYISFYN